MSYRRVDEHSLTEEFVNVTPTPQFPRLGAAHDGVAEFLEMLGRVLTDG